MALINPYIFREYDIRGKVSEDFPEHVVTKLGKALGTFVNRSGGSEIAISGDIRLTPPELINQFKAGVITTGGAGIAFPISLPLVVVIFPSSVSSPLGSVSTIVIGPPLTSAP